MEQENYIIAMKGGTQTFNEEWFGKEVNGSYDVILMEALRKIQAKSNIDVFVEFYDSCTNVKWELPTWNDYTIGIWKTRKGMQDWQARIHFDRDGEFPRAEIEYVCLFPADDMKSALIRGVYKWNKATPEKLGAACKVAITEVLRKRDLADKETIL